MRSGKRAGGWGSQPARWRLARRRRAGPGCVPIWNTDVGSGVIVCMNTVTTPTRTYTTIQAAAKAWAKPLGIRGRQGSSYLYCDGDTYRPTFNNYAAVRGWGQLGYRLEDQGIIVPVYAAPDQDGRRRFLGYEVKR